MTSATSATMQPLLEVSTQIGTLIVYKPDQSQMKQTAKIAKEIFVEAFSTTYGRYHAASRAVEPIEKWLGLKEGVKVTEWLSATFDEEYQEYLDGKKEFVYLCHPDKTLIGWLSHTPVSDTGELYLSQCSLEAESRNQKVATTAFATALDKENITKLFPGIKEVKLIARKINLLASRLYTNAGFTKDETIDPKVYGESYNNRYVGYRLTIETTEI